MSRGTQLNDELMVPLILISPTSYKPSSNSSAAVLRNSGSGTGENRTPKQLEAHIMNAVMLHPAPAVQPLSHKQHHQQQQKQVAPVWTWQSLLVPFVCLCWVMSSSGAILVNKYLLVDINFPYPCTVAALGVGGTSLISCCCWWLQQRLQKSAATPAGNSNSSTTTSGRSNKSNPGGRKRQPSGGRVSWSHYFGYIVPAGLCLALSMQLGNAAYLHLSVSYIQMLKAFTPVVTMLFAFIFGLERPSLMLVSAVGLITAGVAVASWGEGALSAVGVAVMVASKVAEALRLVLAQAVLSKRSIRMHPMQALAFISPAATVWMVLIAGTTEALDMWQGGSLHDILKHPGALLASAVFGFLANAMAMVVISLSGALTLKCIGMAKDVGLVLWGVMALGEVVSALQGVGYGISLSGFVMFNVAKHLQTQQQHNKCGAKQQPDTLAEVGAKPGASSKKSSKSWRQQQQQSSVSTAPQQPGDVKSARSSLPSPAVAAAAAKARRDSGGVRVDVLLLSGGKPGSSSSGATGAAGAVCEEGVAIETPKELLAAACGPASSPLTPPQQQQWHQKQPSLQTPRLLPTPRQLQQQRLVV